MSVIVLNSAEVVLPLDGSSGLSVEQLRSFCDRIAADDGVPPDIVIYTSSGEAEVLGNDTAATIAFSYRRRYPRAQHAFIGVGCLGLSAGILHFLADSARSALLVFLETPQDYLQSCLDLSGIGHPGDGLNAREGVGVVRLLKKEAAALSQNDCVVSGCRILSKPNGLAGTYVLLKQLKKFLCARERPETFDMVSFEVYSPWSERLKRGFDESVLPLGTIRRILPSCEVDNGHRLALKPVIEWLYYEQSRNGAPLALATLGGGGRVGIVLLEAGRPGMAVEYPTRAPGISMGRVLVQSEMRGQTLRTEPLLYCREEHRGIDNIYFRWNVEFLDRAGSGDNNPGSSGNRVGKLRGVVAWKAAPVLGFRHLSLPGVLA